MTTYNIAKAKIVYEYGDAGHFDIVTFDKETDKHISTYRGVDMHKAFQEALLHLRLGRRFLVLQFPKEMGLSERFEAEKTYKSALQYAAKWSTNR